jgi:hypothetical protein
MAALSAIINDMPKTRKLTGALRWAAIASSATGNAGEEAIRQATAGTLANYVPNIPTEWLMLGNAHLVPSSDSCIDDRNTTMADLLHAPLCVNSTKKYASINGNSLQLGQLVGASIANAGMRKFMDKDSVKSVVATLSGDKQIDDYAEEEMCAFWNKFYRSYGVLNNSPRSMRLLYNLPTLVALWIFAVGATAWCLPDVFPEQPPGGPNAPTLLLTGAPAKPKFVYKKQRNNTIPVDMKLVPTTGFYEGSWEATENGVKTYYKQTQKGMTQPHVTAPDDIVKREIRQVGQRGFTEYKED